MIRIKLFALFIAFALLALVRPRKCLELLEAADAGVKANRNEKTEPAPLDHGDTVLRVQKALGMTDTGWLSPDIVIHYLEKAIQSDSRRCTRRAGHDGPCAAVVK